MSKQPKGPSSFWGEERNENRNADRTPFAFLDLFGVWTQCVLELHPGSIALGAGRPVSECAHSVTLRPLYRRVSGSRGCAPAGEPLRSAGAHAARTGDRKHTVVPPAFEPRGSGVSDHRRNLLGTSGFSSPSILLQLVRATDGLSSYKEDPTESVCSS